MIPAKFVASLHASLRANERGLPSEIVRAIHAGNCRRVRIYSDFGAQAEALIARDTEGFWVGVICHRVIITVYHVKHGQEFGSWCFSKLVNGTDQIRLLRLKPVLTWKEETTQELASLWLDA